MRDYFKPDRRKLGVVTLVLALVCLAMWVQNEAFYIRFEPEDYVVNYADFHSTVTPASLFSAWCLLSRPRKPEKF